MIPPFWITCLTIEDDDLCAICANLRYRPGDESRCRWNFPCKWKDGYAVECDWYRQCDQGANLDLTFINQLENQPMTKNHEITITIEGGSGAGKTVLANAIGDFLEDVVDSVTVRDDVGLPHAPDAVALKKMPGRHVVIETKAARYQAPEEPAVVTADFKSLEQRILASMEAAATEQCILGTATGREFEIRRNQEYDLACAAEDAPPSDDDWVMGIRRAAIYRIRWGRGLNILVDHAWNGVTRTTVVPVAYEERPNAPARNLESFLKAREVLAREFMKDWPAVVPSKWMKSASPVDEEECRVVLVPDEKRPW